MAEPSSWIRLNRNIISWRHWKNHRIAIVFLWMLINAQYGEESYIGATKINRGEVATSIDRIADENGISYQQVRDILNVLKKTEEIKDEFTDLWCTFFNTIGIKERENRKCQRKLFPIWRRKHAVEFMQNA